MEAPRIELVQREQVTVSPVSQPRVSVDLPTGTQTPIVERWSQGPVCTVCLRAWREG